MSISERARHLALALAFSAAAPAPALADPGPGLGEPVTAEEIAKWDISVAPDGATLPPGQGDAKRGRVVYQDRCVGCHGTDGEGGEGLADPLAGGIGSLASDKPLKTVGSYWPHATTIFDYVRRAMPYDRPMSLSNADVYAVTAYILALNGIIDETTALNAGTLPKVAMPNRGGFVLHWPEPD